MSGQLTLEDKQSQLLIRKSMIFHALALQIIDKKMYRHYLILEKHF